MESSLGRPEITSSRRVALHLDDWPLDDRMAWERAEHKGGFRDDDGKAADWRPATRRAAIGAYGRYLAWLRDRGLLDMNGGTEKRVTAEFLCEYTLHLRSTVASVTVASYLAILEMMVNALAPAQDWGWLARMRAGRQRNAEPIRDKRSKVVDQRELVDLGFDLMHQAEAMNADMLQQAALLYRDGLLIALLATSPLRQGNYVGIEIGRHLIRVGNGYRLAIPGTETKNRRPDERPVPTVLVPYLERYITHYRLHLTGLRRTRGKSRQHLLPPAAGRLWVTQYGTPFSASAESKVLAKHTTARFGHPINSHLFRDCAATTVAHRRPEQVRIAASVLGHASFATTDRYYVQAADHVAFNDLHDTLEMLLDERETQRRGVRRPRGLDKSKSRAAPLPSPSAVVGALIPKQ